MADSKTIEAINAALHARDLGAVKSVIFNLAREKGMATVAREIDRSREALYRTLQAEGGSMRLDTFLGLLDALGLKMGVSSKTSARKR